MLSYHTQNYLPESLCKIRRTKVLFTIFIFGMFTQFYGKIDKIVDFLWIPQEAINNHNYDGLRRKSNPSNCPPRVKRSHYFGRQTNVFGSTAWLRSDVHSPQVRYDPRMT